MGEVFADPTALRGLASGLDKAREELSGLVARARSVGAGEAVAGLGDFPGWSTDRSEVLRRSASIVEELEGRRVDWNTAMAPGSDMLKAAAALGYNPISLLPDQGQPGLRQVLAGLPADADAARRAEAVAAWWAQLSPVEQVAVVTKSPDAIGNLDGIAFGARDQANRIRLAQAHAALAESLPFGPPGQDPVAPGVLTPENVSLPDSTWEEIKTLQAIEATLARHSPPRQLVTLDLTGGSHARAAVAVGDMDTAANVAVFTPGLSTTVASSLTGYDLRMAALLKSSVRFARDAGRPTSVATVSWIGYDAPLWGELIDPWHSVAAPIAARRGAEMLNGFYAGLDADRPDDPHVTALGHSYGSLTTSFALQRGNTGADDVVLFGSPGLGTSDVNDLKVKPGHVFVLESRDDAVADLAAFGPDPNEMDGVTNLSTSKANTSLGPRNESVGHSAYLADNSTAQYNIASVVAGLPEQTVRGRQFGVGDVLNYPATKVDRWIH